VECVTVTITITNQDDREWNWFYVRYLVLIVHGLISQLIRVRLSVTTHHQRRRGVLPGKTPTPTGFLLPLCSYFQSILIDTLASLSFFITLPTAISKSS